MRAQSKKQSLQDNPRNEGSNIVNQKLEDCETSGKQLSKKNQNQFNLSDGLPMQVSVEQLKAILSQPANNISDKVVLLDARDRLIRYKKDAKEKSITIEKAKTLKGTCLDMCPEKERYSRAEKRRLALYEMLPANDKEYEVDHRLAVKEYSRSSADQAAPLDHELRPLPVLQMTMDYLISRILDRCEYEEDKLPEWFNFLWDRMRGIRKDLTQQNLCELGSVDLMEKCARFHIHCTARLCELDMQDFDQKINDENLTKCMQTLKHMYYDLSLKNVFCPNEAEFRSYDVLLHLNDGEVLREVLQLRAEIRSSCEVRNALKFVNALNSCNYVRFFKLARLNQDYLQSCLLQRYFSQIRGQAFKIMVQAYGPPKMGHIHLKNLIAILGYEDEQEAASWCQCYGLPIDSLKRTVKFDRSTFVEDPEKIPSMRRSSIIESKRKTLVSECIAKGLVPEDPTVNHVPFNSFSSNGYLLKEAWSLDDNEEVDSANPPSAPISSSVAKLPSSANLVTSNVDVDSFSRKLCFQLINAGTKEVVTEVAHEFVTKSRTIAKLSAKICDNYLSEFIRGLCAEIVNDVVLELNAVKVHQEQRRQFIESMAKTLTIQLYNNVLNDVIHEEMKLLGKEAIQEVSCLRAEFARENFVRRLLKSLLDEAITKESQAVAHAVARQAIQTREEMVSRVSEVVGEFRIRRWIRQWRQFTEIQIRRRKEKQTFPACPSRLDFPQQISSLKSKGERIGQPMKRKSLIEQNLKVKRLNSYSDLRFNLNKISTALEETSFDLFTFLDSSLRYRPCKERHSYWKLVILAVDCKEDVGEMFRKWFGFTTTKQTKDGWVFTETRTREDPFTVCVRFVYDSQQIAGILSGAHGLIIVYNPYEDVKSSLEKIARLVHIQSKYSHVPVATIATNACCPEKVLQSCFHVVIDFKQPLINKQTILGEILSNLFGNFVDRNGRASLSTELTTCTLWELANHFVSSKILTTVYRDLKTRLELNLPHQELHQLIDFSNCAVQHLLEDVLADSELLDVKWPPPELVEISSLNFPPVHWNSREYQQRVNKVLEKYLILPSFDFSSDNQNLSSLCDSLRNYCTLLSTSESNAAAFLLRADSILTNNLLDHHHGDDSDYCVPWTEIYQACIDYRLEALFVEGSSMVTAYFRRSLENLHSSGSWSRAIHFLESPGPGTQRLERSETHSNAGTTYLNAYGHHNKSLDLPFEIASLCDSIVETSKQAQQENERFQERLSRVLSPYQPSHRRSPTKLCTADLNMMENLDLLESKLKKSREEDKQFESFLKRALGNT